MQGVPRRDLPDLHLHPCPAAGWLCGLEQGSQFEPRFLHLRTGTVSLFVGVGGRAESV